MHTIHILSAEEAQKIAAGEVIERPANIIKELIENSLDAGATELTLYVEEGGKKSIRIIDNGCGMSPIDARLCIKTHATSKIKTIADLETVTTFGFRGEGLASVAAISRMTLITKTAVDSVGTQLVIEHGAIIHESLVSCNTGTNIFIEDIFAAIPARRKFLKTKETEWRAIYQLIQAIALAHPECRFTLFHEKHEILSCLPVPSTAERFAQIFEKQCAQAHVSHEYKDHTITIHGVCTNHQYARYDRSLIYFFVNGRWVKNFKLGQALMRGYLNVLPTDRYPAAAVFITCNTNEVDVNIHPRKEEVLFLHPRMIEQAIEKWATTALEKYISTSLQSATSNQLTSTSYTLPPYTFNTIPGSTRPQPLAAPQIMAPPIQPALVEEKIVQHDLFKESMKNVPHFMIVGQIKATYILIEQEDSLIMIDQHAAHERILYEQYAATCSEYESIELLFPPIFELSSDDSAVIHEYRSIFESHKIVVEAHPHNRWMLRAVPLILKQHASEELVKECITIIRAERHGHDLSKTITEKVRAMMACKGAVKAGDQLTHTHMYELIQTLLSTPNRLSCPHGRPTLWRLTWNEIERMFKRNYA